MYRNRKPNETKIIIAGILILGNNLGISNFIHIHHSNDYFHIPVFNLALKPNKLGTYKNSYKLNSHSYIINGVS